MAVAGMNAGFLGKGVGGDFKQRHRGQPEPLFQLKSRTEIHLFQVPGTRPFQVMLVDELGHPGEFRLVPPARRV